MFFSRAFFILCTATLFIAMYIGIRTSSFTELYTFFFLFLSSMLVLYIDVVV